MRMWQLFLFLAVTGVLPGCANRSGTEARAQPREGYIQSHDGVALYYRTLGVAGDTIIVVHCGPFVDHGYLAPELEPLAETHVLIFYDQRGTGKSTLVSDAASHRRPRCGSGGGAAALPARTHDRPRSLLGSPAGGGLRPRIFDNVSALIAVSPAPLRREPYWDEVLPRVTAWMDSTTLQELDARDAARRDPANDAHDSCRAFFELLVRGALAAHSDVPMARRIAAGFCSAPAAAIRIGPVVDSLTMASLGDYDWRQQFRESRFPVLVIAGTKDVDRADAYQEWHAAFADARLVLLADAGHFSYVEQPEQFVGVVMGFLRSHDRGRVDQVTGDSG